MSDVTKLAKGEITPAEFAAKVAGEINSNPVEKACAQWLLDGLYALLARYLGSTTLAHIVTAAVKAALEPEVTGGLLASGTITAQVNAPATA